MSQIRIPYELIDIIVSNLDVNSTALSAVALANHALANIAREHRFKEVTIRSADRCNALWNLIERNPVLGHQLRSLSVISDRMFTGSTFRTTSPVDGVWVPRRAEEESFLPRVLDSLTAIQTLDLCLSVRWTSVTKNLVEALSNLFGRSTLTILSLVDIHGIDLRPLVNCRSLQHLTLDRIQPSIESPAGPETHLPPQLRTLVVHSPPLSAYGSYISHGLLPHHSLREYRLRNVCNSYLGQLDPTDLLVAFVKCPALRVIEICITIYGENVTWMLPIVEGLTRMTLLQDLKLELIHIVPPFDPFPNLDPTARARSLPEALEFWEKLDGLSRLSNLRNVLIVFNKRLKDIPEYEEERLKKNMPLLLARDDVRVLIDWHTPRIFRQ